MRRIELIEKLELVAPALSNNELMPLWTYFWFTGDEVMAYNGHVAISTKCETDFKGAVPGLLLLSLMKASSAKQVEFDHRDGTLHIKAASSKFKLPTRPEKEFRNVHQMPEAPKYALPVKPDEFLASIATCMRSISMDTSVPDYLGVTLIPRKSKLAFYATNHVTLSHAEIACKGTDFPRAILPNLFCKQLLAMADKTKPLKLQVTNEYVMYAGPGGTRLFGLLVESEHPMDFDAIFADHFTIKDDTTLVPIASKLEKIFDRACIVASGESSVVRTQIEVRDNIAVFETESRLGRVSDTMELPKQHGDVDIELDPKWVRAGVGDFDRMVITDRCLVMANATAFYMVSGKD